MDYQLGPGPLQVDQNTIDEKIKGDIGIVENGDVATHAIPSGYYVIWKGDLYVAKTDISSGTTLSAASNGNLTAKSNGLGAEVASLSSSITSLETAVTPGSNRNDFSEYDTIKKIFNGIRSATDGSAFGFVGSMQNTALKTLLGNPGIGNYVRCNMTLVNWSSILCIAVSEASFDMPKMKWLYHAEYSGAENYYNQTEWSKVNLNSDIASLNSKLTTFIDYSSGVELISGATATSITAKRIGSAVVVNVSGLRLPTTASVWTTIFTLPEGCRPPFQIYQTLLFDTLPDSAHHHATEISVNANGTVNMYAPVADATYWGSLVFPISY